MDRFGTRRVTLFFVWTAMALAPVFPLIPWFWPLLVLQIVNGGALSFAWSGSQTLIAQLAEGEAEYIGRFSFFARIGSTVAPLLAGIAWDRGGPWPSYMLGFAWGVVLTIALLRAPEAEIAPGSGAVAGRPARFRARDALPHLPDYVRCFALMAIPAVATTMAIIFLRTATNGVQSSLYVVYLNGMGLTGTSIGVLFAAIEITSGLGSLFAGRAMRLGDPQRTMLTGTVLSVLLISVTPFIGAVFTLLLVAQALRGWLQGVVQPVMFSVQAKAVGRYRQGSVVGLRQTMNRLAAIVIPPAMGAIADQWGAGSELCHPRGCPADAVRAGRADHPPHRAGRDIGHSFATAEPRNRRQDDTRFRRLRPRAAACPMARRRPHRRQFRDQFRGRVRALLP